MTDESLSPAQSTPSHIGPNANSTELSFFLKSLIAFPVAPCHADEFVSADSVFDFLVDGVQHTVRGEQNRGMTVSDFNKLSYTFSYRRNIFLVARVRRHRKIIRKVEPRVSGIVERATELMNTAFGPS